MTIYSQHPNRGKVQILATYRGSVGVRSSTVTSVDDAVLAAPIVDALNRISAYATVPVSVHDTRDEQFDYYPTDHLATLTDRNARAGLLDGAHSLWYDQVKVLLHLALSDLDDVVAKVPAPVRTAIAAELAAEESGLREAVAEFSEGSGVPAAKERRHWEFDAPFVACDGREYGLNLEVRERLNAVERGASKENLRQGIADLRLLLDAYIRCENDEARLSIDDFSIADDRFEAGIDGLFLNVEAPMPNRAHGRDDWRVEVIRWIPDNPEDEDSNATGEPILRCVRAESPAAAEIAELLNRSGNNEQLSKWMETPVGEPLDGTAFVVAQRWRD
ncbi:hypothetical protein LWC34_05790 [Kibdelosporangium philippinense]|uniref:Uncharacterized protein n=1 Tax=Kibdelosporangium philippinense TaxID=211113 RepID=A0ABS8Z322_9PSEU|nr:hypothetical protein [Kibdelosporangium philippinense]MCE7002344.1 hypothetical protein [Kibdelosporangium philippinense]